MDIEEAMRAAAERTEEILEELEELMLEDIATQYFAGVPEGGEVSEAMRTLAKVAFVAGRIYQDSEQDTTQSVEQKFRVVSAFIDFINEI